MSFETADSSAALHQLAERLGVLRHYVSASGETRTVGDASLRLLCTALGFDARSDATVQAALSSLLEPGALVDPVVVASEGQPLLTAWRAAPLGEAATIRWQIMLETGGEVGGETTLVNDASQASIHIALDGVPIGYHRLTVSQGSDSASSTLIVAPHRCWTPTQWQTEGRRDWSLTTQLYSLRSDQNWGIGDFSDLGALARQAAAHGAASIGLNPLHALFPANPRHLSPYSPSSRVFLNPVYIDVEAVPESSSTAARQLIDSPAFQSRLQGARASELVDYEAVWGLKLQALRALFDEFRKQTSHQPQGERARAFQAFREQAGAGLARFALFEALQQHMVEGGTGLSWHAWPAAFRDIDSAEVSSFRASHADAIAFSEFLQWEADRQLGSAAGLMHELGMSSGVYRDVAVGVDPNGAEAWGDQTLLVSGASVGAPPDDYNPKGQDWGLTPFNPIALRQRGYAPFIAAIRANMRHAGAVRIDHVIGLKRLFWVPTGEGPAAGGYVAYPYDDLMAIIALESQRQQCLVVGEDLGTVPAGFREDAVSRALLSYRVLMFERADGYGDFLSPTHYPELAAAAVSTHDLPTLAGLWAARDLEWRSTLALYPDPDDAQRDNEFRRATRHALIAALQAHGDLPADAAARLSGGTPTSAEALADLITAAHAFLAKAPSRLMLVQIEDLASEVEQMNLPGTVDQHPNWRRKLRCSIDELFADPAVARTTSAIVRGRASGAAA